MAQYKIDDTDRLKLHYNAIRSHAAGCGDPVDPFYVRSAMITLLSNFSQGYSGIHPEVVELIKDLVNKQIIPVVPEHGGVGASGDLVQLAHIALVLIGEGEVILERGGHSHLRGFCAKQSETDFSSFAGRIIPDQWYLFYDRHRHGKPASTRKILLTGPCGSHHDQ